jgi:histidine triad (HIT) family protein
VSTDCIFCKIVADELPANIIWQDEDVIAFPDIAPKAPTHLLVVPRRHLQNIVEAADEPAVAAAIVRAVAAVARQEGLSDFNTVFNTGAGSGQSVFHVHGHLLAGANLWRDGFA